MSNQQELEVETCAASRLVVSAYPGLSCLNYYPGLVAVIITALTPKASAEF
jgi:hypothetical protein